MMIMLHAVFHMAHDGVPYKVLFEENVYDVDGPAYKFTVFGPGNDGRQVFAKGVCDNVTLEVGSFVISSALGNEPMDLKP